MKTYLPVISDDPHLIMFQGYLNTIYFRFMSLIEIFRLWTGVTKFARFAKKKYTCLWQIEVMFRTTYCISSLRVLLLKQRFENSRSLQHGYLFQKKE